MLGACRHHKELGGRAYVFCSLYQWNSVFWWVVVGICGKVFYVCNYRRDVLSNKRRYHIWYNFHNLYIFYNRDVYIYLIIISILFIFDNGKHLKHFMLPPCLQLTLITYFYPTTFNPTLLFNIIQFMHIPFYPWLHFFVIKFIM